MPDSNPDTRNDNDHELRDRLSLIESMITEGRRTTESWGWIFVLWGAAYLIAIAWSAWWGHAAFAWPVTVVAAIIITVVGASSVQGHQPETTVGRAIVSIWIALCISMFLLFLPLSISGRLTDPRVFVAVASAILGMANGASGFILRWKMQLACALVWWATAVASCFASENQSLVEFLIAIFFCQIVFGIYGMIAESRERARHRQTQNGPAHA